MLVAAKELGILAIKTVVVTGSALTTYEVFDKTKEMAWAGAKKIGEYTCRGTIEGESTTPVWDRIILFDGRFDTAYRVVEFVIASSSSSSAQDVAAKLATEITSTTTTGLGSVWDWSDNREIAWASTNNLVTSIRHNEFSLVDPDNLVVEDLYISATNNAGTGEDVNYFIRMEKYDITDSQGALAMVRNRSQA